MNVDMSPEAVTSRLPTMDDLWLLSQKLINSRQAKSSVLANDEGERENFRESVNVDELENE